MASTILAVGAAGKFAGLVLPALAKRGARVRGLVRDPADAEGVQRHGAAEVAIGDLRDRAALDAALRGVDKVFYISPTALEDEVAVGRGVVDAAKAAGVQRFVFSALIHPEIGAMSHHVAKAAIEEAVLASNMPYTFLHPAVFFQNITAEDLAGAAASGTFAEPWSTQARLSRVDFRDVAEVAAIALLEDRLAYGTFELCAEGRPDREDLAALMAAALGQAVRAGRLASGPDKPPPVMAAMFNWYDKHGLPGNALILRSILGREPATLRAYLGELAAELKAAPAPLPRVA